MLERTIIPDMARSWLKVVQAQELTVLLGEKQAPAVLQPNNHLIAAVAAGYCHFWFIKRQSTNEVGWKKWSHSLVSIAFKCRCSGGSERRTGAQDCLHLSRMNVTVQLIIDVKVTTVLQWGTTGRTTKALCMQWLVVDAHKNTTTKEGRS